MDLRVTINDAVQALADSSEKFVQLLQHGSMKVEYYKPVLVDLQTPHKQNELYVVISGTGNFNRNGEIISFNAHDVLFVPAGMPHRFENFSADFATWVIFYGADGGEINNLL